MNSPFPPRTTRPRALSSYVQVREQLKATDSWGRSIFGHAVLTGRPKVFDAVFFAAREHILDDEVLVLL